MITRITGTPLRRRILAASAFTLVVAVAATGGFSSADRGEALVATNDTAVTTTTMPTCPDQGDGEVWIADNEILDCDVEAWQTLNITDVPDEATCDYYGGAYLPDVKVCYDVDF